MPRIISLTLALILPLNAGEIRTWTSPDGAKTFNAEFISRDEDTVTLRRAGSKEMTLGIDKIHKDDKSWLIKNHPTESETKAMEVPDNSVVFDTLKFGDSRNAVMAKLEASKMVESNLNSTFLGRTGINGIYRTVQKIGGLHCYLFFDWDENNRLKEITLRTEDMTVDVYETVLKPCWLAMNELIMPIYGKPLQTTKMPAASELTDEAMIASHLWRIEGGGTVLLGPSRQDGKYQVSIRFTSETIEVRRVP